MYLKRLLALAEQGRVFNSDAGTSGDGGAASDGAAAGTVPDTNAAGDDGDSGILSSGDGGGAISEGGRSRDASGRFAPKAGEGDAPAWGENWRADLAGGDEARLKRFERYTTPKAIADALIAAQDHIAKGGHRAPAELPEDATPEEVAAYRKAAGVPEKPEGYGLAFPQGYGAGDAENERLGRFAAFMHGRHQSPSAAKAAFEFFVEDTAAMREAAIEAAEEATITQMADLRKDFSPNELRRNNAILEGFLQQNFGQSHEAFSVIKTVLNLRMPSGERVEDNAAFKKAFFTMARRYAEDDALIAGDVAGSGKSLEDEKAALLEKSVAGTITPRENQRLDQLYEEQARRNARRGGREAA